MAIDNLNFYSAWLPAGQQTDRYSSQPWCLRSKNLDIFSSSKSVKATAFSQPIAWDSWVIASEWPLELRADGKVYENWVEFIDPAANFPVYQVCYSWWRYGTYEDAQRWTPQSMSVAMEWDEWKSFVVFTDRASFVYSKVKYTPNKVFGDKSSNLTQTETEPVDYGYPFQKNSSSWATSYIDIRLPEWQMSTVPIRIYADQNASSDTDITLDSITLQKDKYYLDAQDDTLYPTADTSVNLSLPQWDIKDGWWILVNIPTLPLRSANTRKWIRITVKYTRHEWITSGYAWTGTLYIWMNDDESNNYLWLWWDYNYYYTYLPVRDRELAEVWEYYWMKWATFQTLYQWESSWVTISWNKVTRYDFVQYMWWANDPWMDVIWLISWNEQISMIWNLKGNWYIIPCDLTGGRGTPYIAYGSEFKWVSNIDYLLYLVWEDRGISGLWVYNGQELVRAIWWNKEVSKIDLLDDEEQYKFDWKIVNWRKNLILATTDNRIFQYWQTYGGKWWVFIHQLPSNAVITGLKANWNDLVINYSITVNDTTTNYTTTYQDDVPVKNYNTEWEAVYPIVLWNHLLEKEESDLYASFILPSSSCKLEFWGMANHYHFWTFTSGDNATLSETESYKIKWSSGAYALKFIEKNWNQYTFRLEWDLPVQTTGEKQIIDSNNTVVINYTDFNHFRKIWTIETDKYGEWEFRFHNLNNKLELPKSHSLQIMVKGKGTANYTPELFSVDLVANQRERW